MNKIKHTSIIFLFLLSIVPVFAFAIGPTTLPTPTGAGTSSERPLIICGGPPPQIPCSVEHFKLLIQNILNLVFIFAGFIAATMFMYAGFLLITAAGNTGQIQKAKDIFKRVVIGFLIMFGSYLLVKNLLTHIGALEFFRNLIT